MKSYIGKLIYDGFLMSVLAPALNQVRITLSFHLKNIFSIVLNANDNIMMKPFENAFFPHSFTLLLDLPLDRTLGTGTTTLKLGLEIKCIILYIILNT